MRSSSKETIGMKCQAEGAGVGNKQNTTSVSSAVVALALDRCFFQSKRIDIFLISPWKHVDSTH